MGTKTPGLGKASGNLDFDAHLDDGDYLLEAIAAQKRPKPAQGMDPQDEDCPINHVVRTTILGGPEQRNGEDPSGRPWTVFMYVNPDSEWTDFQVNKLKNMIDAFGVPVRADDYKPENFEGTRAVMRIVNKIQEKGKYKGEERSEIQKFLAVEDSEFA